jgi:hypothetical protein
MDTAMETAFFSFFVIQMPLSSPYTFTITREIFLLLKKKDVIINLLRSSIKHGGSDVFYTALVVRIEVYKTNTNTIYRRLLQY